MKGSLVINMKTISRRIEAGDYVKYILAFPWKWLLTGHWGSLFPEQTKKCLSDVL